jgi:uncharacterized protein YidB (DUF937 family)
MGLLDVLNGMQNGPRGQKVPSPAGSGSSGGMSPILLAVLGLLAYKATKGLTSQPSAAPAAPGAHAGGLGDLLRGGNAAPDQSTGGLLSSGLGGLLGGGAAGSVLSGGLKDLLDQFQQSGHGDVAKSWVGTGPNQPVSPGDLARTLGGDQINALASRTGMSRDELLSALSEHLPEVVNQMTPDGKVPTANELSRWL